MGVAKKDQEIRVRRSESELLITYLRYAIEDVRSISPQSASLLVSAIAALTNDASDEDLGPSETAQQ